MSEGYRAAIATRRGGRNLPRRRRGRHVMNPDAVIDALTDIIGSILASDDCLPNSTSDLPGTSAPVGATVLC
jgi:hypothetical protein